MVNSDSIANLTLLNLKAAEQGLAIAQKWLGTMYKKEVLPMNMKNSERHRVQHEKAYHEEMKQLEEDLSTLMEETEHES